MAIIDKDKYSIVLIGAGNLATNLGKALKSKGFHIVQVYSRTRESASKLATLLNADTTTSLEEVREDADLYIVSLSDSAFEKLVPEITKGKNKGLFVHTAGSIPMSIWEGYTDHGGVFYPMQTFSRSREVNFTRIPVFLEANDDRDLQILSYIASELSSKVHIISSEQRKVLHLSAVFACNFTNHMYALADHLLRKYDIPFDVMLPLIDETTQKAHQLSPKEAQTGPAIRYDKNVINKHLELLADEPAIQELYERISQSIYKEGK